ncbi:MAG: serine hydrolase domain-containing protein [Vicinamibacterales bacterium]|nr:serine hydrolase domain-containing protein [Vicinamibacterales bacterium]
MRLRIRSLVLPASLTLGLVTATACAPASPTVNDEGVSSARLQRLSSAMQRAVNDGELAGLVTLVAHRGRIAHHEAFGHLDREAGVAMGRDAIFRIASMTKPVTSVAAMMLMEEGRLLLNDPVRKFLPAFEQTTVMGATPGDRVAARRPITVRDLLTHTAGVSYGTGPLEALYKQHDLYYWYFAHRAEPIGETMTRLAALPFAAQPGERWVYGFGTDILGAVVEQASGQTLDAFFEERIFAPLGMRDTSFYLPPEKRSRLAAVYSSDADGLTRAPEAWIGQGDYVEGPRQSFSGGAGLLSTAGDYARFLQMLLNGGELEGARLLSPTTVALMTSDHVGTLYDTSGGLGFGLGFETVEHVGRAGRPSSAGEYSWAGAYFTEFWVDPAHEVVAVFMAQLLPARSVPVRDRFRALVYQAIVE